MTSYFSQQTSSLNGIIENHQAKVNKAAFEQEEAERAAAALMYSQMLEF